MALLLRARARPAPRLRSDPSLSPFNSSGLIRLGRRRRRPRNPPKWLLRKINPNYSRPQVSEKREKKSSLFVFGEDDSTKRIDEVTSNGKKPAELTNDELLICCPTARSEERR